MEQGPQQAQTHPQTLTKQPNVRPMEYYVMFNSCKRDYKDSDSERLNQIQELNKQIKELQEKMMKKREGCSGES